MRAKLELLCREAGRAVRWHTALAREWIAGVVSSELVFYADGHVRVYHGDLTALPRHYVARERLCMRATTDYWIHAMDRSEEHTSELQSQFHLVCRLLLEKKKRVLL